MKKTTKIISGLIAFVLIGEILLFANGLVGNPISKFLANRGAGKYIEETYPNMELETDKATFNFKTGGYSVFVKSPNSIDTHFSLSISLTGDIVWDSYESYVLDKFNTWDRVNMEYRKMVDNIFESDDFPYRSNIDYGNLKLKEKESHEPFGPIYGVSLEELELDKIYDIKELGKTSGQIVLYIEDEKINVERASEILLHVKDIFEEKDVPFYAIDFSLEEPKTEEKKPYHERKIFQVRDFLYTDIYEKDLIERLEKASDDLADYYEKEDAKKRKLNY